MDPQVIRHRVEWPTVVLGMVIVAMYGLVTWFHHSLPLPVGLFGLAWSGAWWSSFQHELIHQHPFADQRTNDAIGRLSFVLWLPYEAYKVAHLRHHHDDNLTDPIEDPESYYRSGEVWSSMPRWQQQLWWFHRTLFGRLTVGPLLAMGGFIALGVRDVVHGRPGARRGWGEHLVVVAVVLAWAVGVCGVPWWQYLLGGVWGATSLMKVRSFAEHRWVPGEASRSAMVHAEPPLALLYLNNNLHHTHHARPGVPWYRLPAVAREIGSDAAAAAGAGVYRGYREVARRYLFRPFCVPVHPAAPEAADLVAARMATA